MDPPAPTGRASNGQGSIPQSSTKFEQVRAYGPHCRYRHWLGSPANRLADCGLILTDAADVCAQELSNRPTDTDHEHRSALKRRTTAPGRWIGSTPGSPWRQGA